MAINEWNIYKIVTSSQSQNHTVVLLQFIKAAGLAVQPDDVWQFAMQVIAPQGIEAHQMPSEDISDTTIVGLLELAARVVPTEEVFVTR